jgi:crotonobetainyl-CoA:carnitine CoA-transferase CaiB-like acyl-CoA transferase
MLMSGSVGVSTARSAQVEEKVAKALDGIRVIDLTMWFQGPVAAQHLADLGAEVIHLESPKGGDLARGVRSIKALAIGDWNQYFLVINRNKKSMAVDLNQPQGREILHRLVEKSDVVLSNLSTKALEKWEAGYERLSRINPRLVYAMGSGYGPHGNITKPSFDMTVQALIGLMTRQGEPGQPPVYLGMGSGDAMGGMMAALGIMLALYAREQTGRGQFLDASLYGAQLFMAAPSFQAFLATGSQRYSRQVSRREPDNPLTNTYPCSDRWLFLCADEGNESWSRIKRVLGAKDLDADSRFATPEARRRERTVLVAALDRLFEQKTADHWAERLQAEGVPASPIGSFQQLAEDPQCWANDYLMKAHCSEVDREVTIRGLPVGFSKTPGEVTCLGPELGQDTEMILFETLGYDWDRIGELKSSRAIL